MATPSGLAPSEISLMIAPKILQMLHILSELEVNAELTPADRLVMFPPVELADGEPVTAVEKPN